MDASKLIEILKKHAKWIRGEEGGERANLQSADLRYADLQSANLQSADLRYANLQSADLQSANLQSADLQSANLQSADLRYAKGASLAIARTRVVPPEGDVIGWKKCRDGVLVKLKIPAKSRRSNAFGRKCRAEYAKVIEVVGAEFGISIRDAATEYRAGKIVRCDSWNEDFQVECGGGIHFYITKEEAEAHA